MVGGETAAPWGKRGSYFLAVPTADMRLRPSPQPIAAKRTTPVRAALLDRRPGSAEDLGRGRLTAGQRHLGPGLVVARGVHHDARLRHVGQVELADGEAERAGPRMQVGEGTRLGLGDLVPGPDRVWRGMPVRSAAMAGPRSHRAASHGPPPASSRDAP